MKHIKYFEKQLTTEEKERIGNYLITNPVYANLREKKYFNETIGQIVGININPIGNDNSFKIKYDKESIPSHVILNRDNTYYVQNYEIVLEYKSKEDLEAFIMSKKYNL